MNIVKDLLISNQGLREDLRTANDKERFYIAEKATLLVHPLYQG
jgi:hypothetical protein